MYVVMKEVDLTILLKYKVFSLLRSGLCFLVSCVMKQDQVLPKVYTLPDVPESFSHPTGTTEGSGEDL